MTRVSDKVEGPVSAADYRIEQELWQAGHVHIAGTDEAGRGCLAGPVVAAAVVLSDQIDISAVRDSKVVPESERRDLETEIKSKAIAWAVASCTPEEIDKLNILWASMEAMARAVSMLKYAATYVIADGNQVPPEQPVPWKSIVKGDGISMSIAAASILAKVERDRIMTKLSTKYPDYGWDKNFGYPTEQHYDALATCGATPHHRRSFRLFDTQYDLFQSKQVPPKTEGLG